MEIKWRKNIYKVPAVTISKNFVNESPDFLSYETRMRQLR